MEAKTKAVEGVFRLPHRKVEIRPIPRSNSLTTDERAQFILGQSSFTVTVPRLRNGKFVQILTDKEKAFFEDPSRSQMEFETGDLNLYKSSDNFWETFSYKLYNYPIELDLSYPEDYITYKVLKANEMFIAPNWDSRYNKQTYMYAIVDTSAELTKKVLRSDTLADAYAKYAEIKGSNIKLANVLRLIHKKMVPYDTDIEFLKEQLTEILDGPKGPEIFLEAANDPSMTEKLFILEAIKAGVLDYRGTAYYQPGNPQPIGYNWNEVVSWLQDPENQEAYLLMKHAVESND